MTGPASPHPRNPSALAALAALAFLALALLLLAGPARADILDTLFTAQEWQAKGDLETASEAVRGAIDQAPDNTFARIRLAQLDAALGNPIAALANLNTLLAREPDNQLALLWKGHILLGQRPPGDPAQARLCYARLAALDPASAWAMAGLALCLLDEAQDQQALPLLEKAQALAGDDGPLHHLLGNTYAALGLGVNARLELERALELNPRHLAALASLGEVYLRLGQDGLALDAWRQALAMDASDQHARQRLIAALTVQARQAAASGNATEAARLWRTILGYDPGNAEALWWLRQGAALHPPGGQRPPGPPQ